ncbi:translation initiation factor 2 [Paenisporosarcina macmurdoensis]|uniref:Translation initiation factor 2 n=1 Tax=Paenisporosarcina macmurdoensis TaxID=212659 RepID=A0ABW1L8A6_9BACL
MNKNNQSTGTQEIDAAKLVLIGSALATLGDALQTISVGLALEVLENQTMPDQTDQLKKIEDNMQKQIDHLTNELSKLKSQIT